MTREQRAGEVLASALDGLQMTDRQAHAACLAILTFADQELERAANVAEAAFDDRSRSRVGHPSHMDWEDGYRDATRASAAAIRQLKEPNNEQL